MSSTVSDKFALSDLRWVALDLETTGVYPNLDGIVEIGLYEFRIEPDNPWPIPVAEYASLVNPERPIPPVVQKIHGISDQMVKDSPPFREIIADLSEKLKDRIILAHNAGFDMSFLQHAYSLHPHLLAPQLPWICTLEISRNWDRGERYHNLSALRQRWHLSAGAEHRALSDSRAAAEVFTNLLCRQKKSAPTWGDLPRNSKRKFYSKEALPVPPLEQIEVLESAIREKTWVNLNYHGSQANQKINRTVIPYFIFYNGSEPMLAAFCQLRQDRRHFFIRKMSDLQKVAANN